MEHNKIIAYKAFKGDMSCRGFQYAVGGEYRTSDDKAVLCKHGFHACLSPIDVLLYYPALNSRFAIVELSGCIDNDDSNDADTKLCSSRIVIKKEISQSSFFSKVCPHFIVQETEPSPSAQYMSTPKAVFDEISAKTDLDEAKLHLALPGQRLAVYGKNNVIMSSASRARICSCGLSTECYIQGQYSMAHMYNRFASVYLSGHNTSVVAEGKDTAIYVTASGCSVFSKCTSATIRVTASSTLVVSECIDAKILVLSGYGNYIHSIGNLAKINVYSDSNFIYSLGHNAIIHIFDIGNVIRAQKGAIIVFHGTDNNTAAPKTVVVGEDIKEDTWYIFDRLGEIREHVV